MDSDQVIIDAIEDGIIGFMVLHGEGEHENFFFEDGWTWEQIQNYVASVNGLAVSIVDIEHR